MIVVSIIGPDMKRALAQVAGSARYAGMFEFRLDLIRSADLPRLLASTTKPAIVTCRPRWEGGTFAGTEEERINILKSASMLGAQYVDLEVRSDPRVIREFLKRRTESHIILSYHHFSQKLPDARKIYRELSAYGAEIIKFAYPASDAFENRLAFDFLALASADRQKSVAIAMGEAGELSRILYKKFGGWGTYAAPEDGAIAAPGQIPASRLVNLYRSENLTQATKVYGVVGGQVRHSKGIFVHNALFRKAKLNRVYCRFPVNNLQAFMRAISPLIDGFSVTIPHKEAVMKFLSAVDPVARQIGAVNTVIRQRKQLVGTNTDAPGALDAIEKVARVRGKRMLIVGAGGAARAIAFEALRRGARVLIANRTAARAKALAKTFGLRAIQMHSATVSPADLSPGEFEFVVNATSVGMTPNVQDSPVAKSLLKGKVVFDAVYNPPLTRLLREAKRAGATIVSGTEMYLNQAIRQSVLFSGRKPDGRLMRRVLSKQA